MYKERENERDQKRKVERGRERRKTRFVSAISRFQLINRITSSSLQ